MPVSGPPGLSVIGPSLVSLLEQCPRASKTFGSTSLRVVSLRWQIEDTFLLTKRLLGLAYLWVGGRNGVQVRLRAAWIYAVLNDVCTQVAVALQQPLERISLELVFRSLYHFSRARQRDATVELMPFLVQYQRSLG